MSKRLCMLLASVLIGLFLMSMVPTSLAAVQRVGMPRFDEIDAIVESDPDVAWERFKAGEFDFLPDIIRAHIIEEAKALNHFTASMPGFHVCYIGINCRDYVPGDAGQPDAGRPLAPLNWTAFRRALAWAGLSLEQKEAAIIDIYGPGIVVPAYTIIPEALGVWHNPNVTAPGGNYTKAWEILQSAGFYIDGGILYQPNGVPVRDEIHVLSPSEAPTSVEFTQRFVNQWNDFFGNYLGVTNCKFINDAIPFNTEVVNAFYYRNFDLYFLCWGLSRFPDFIYDFFHSSQDFPWGYNSPGIKDATLDALLETVKWGLDYDEKLAACYEAQRLLVEELVPYVYLYHRIYWCVWRAHTPDAIVNVINMDGVGADNGWTWNLAHWASEPGGVVKYNLGAEPDNLHPGWADSAYEWWILERVTEGLTAVNPHLADLPWVAVDWDMATFSWPPLNIPQGTVVTFRIRDDAYWADGWPITVEDIKFSWEFMRNFPRYYSTYEYLMWIEIHDPNTISAYLNTTSQYIVYDFAGLGLLFPKHIYNPEWHPTRDTVNDPVWEISWQDWMSDYTGPIPKEVAGWSPGDPIPTGLPDAKALINAGPYYFTVWNPEAVTAVVKKNPNYWVTGPVIAGIDAPGRIDPETDFPFEVVIENVGAKDEATGELTPVSIDYFAVYVDDELITEVSVGAPIDPFDYAVYNVPGWVLNLQCGVHNVTILVYESGVAEPLASTYKIIYVTLREDLNYDIYVGIDDIVRAAEAFGASPPPFPGSERWDERADLNDDFYCGIDDIVDIAEDFGKC